MNKPFGGGGGGKAQNPQEHAKSPSSKEIKTPKDMKSRASLRRRLSSKNVDIQSRLEHLLLVDCIRLIIYSKECKNAPITLLNITPVNARQSWTFYIS